eukprot:8901769-Pyramimonas_sp.AAC.1
MLSARSSTGLVQMPSRRVAFSFIAAPGSARWQKFDAELELRPSTAIYNRGAAFSAPGFGGHICAFAHFVNCCRCEVMPIACEVAWRLSSITMHLCRSSTVIGSALSMSSQRFARSDSVNLLPSAPCWFSSVVAFASCLNGLIHLGCCLLSALLRSRVKYLVGNVVQMPLCSAAAERKRVLPGVGRNRVMVSLRPAALPM